MRTLDAATGARSMSEPSADRPTVTLSDSGLPPPVTLTRPVVEETPVTRREPAAAAIEDCAGRRRLGRFEVHGEIGRGGMGAVLHGRDPALGRDLALKVLLQGHHGNADTVRRFHEEAQIGGQLQHPGLVPVYELGTDAAGRPFFAMKLVQGRTLTDLLRARQTPAEDLPRFLGIFEQVCQAVGYAHARGVIHRDLKPSNVMVGAFGEVQVMDWGLAKVLGPARAGRLPPETPAAGGTVRTTRTEADGTESRTGSVLGTPAYMAPEQARGEVDRLDARADVFGLGAILCEILSGQPPFVGADAGETLGRAARGDLAEAFARLDTGAADAELVRLAKECLNPEAAGRPENGAAVAGRVSAFRAGVAERLHRAELERAAAEARAGAARARARAERRAQRLTLGLVVSVALTVLVGYRAWKEREQQQLEHQAGEARHETEMTQAVTNDLERVARARQEDKLSEARAALERAEGRLGMEGYDDLRQRVRLVREALEREVRDLKLVAALEAARVQAAAGGEGGLDRHGSDRLYRRAFAAHGLDLWQGSVEAVAERVAASPVRESIVSALDEWSEFVLEGKGAEAERLSRIAQLADDRPWRQRLREAILRQDQEEMGRLAGSADVAELSPAELLFLSRVLRSIGRPQQALQVLRQGQQRHPGDLGVNFALALACEAADPPQTAEALRYCTAARALRPKSAAVLLKLGLMLEAQARQPEAEDAFREAVRLQPDFPEAHYNLGLALKGQGKLPEAIAEFQEALRLRPDFPQAKQNLAEAERLREQAQRQPRS
jgi:serine/threonine-protein kinase